MASPYLGIQHIAEAQNQPEVTANGAIDALDASDNAEASFALTDAATAITLTQAQIASGFVLKLTGPLTAARNAVVPAIPRNFVVFNNSTGGFAVTVKTSGGSGISVANGLYVTLYCDGTNVVQLSAGSGGGTVLNFSDNEVPSGSIDGVNTAFTLAFSPSPTSSLILVQNTPAGAVVLIQGTHYTLSGANISTSNPPVTGDGLFAWYRH
ncbi:MAG TPA: hypothetical protein VG456_10800 [Candidatus Sulfopaludibacter sp.]|jgi:hypothetical protein|nr:hypothetical protein [Candidatus Sulfopaludibacter sp.]